MSAADGLCPQPCEHLSAEDAREGKVCAIHPCACIGGVATSGRMIPERFHNAAVEALLREGPLARMAREMREAEDRRDRAAIHGPLSELPRKVPQLGPVSGDGLARLIASRFATPSRIDIWAGAAERVVSAEAEAMARRMREGDDPVNTWEQATPRQRNYWRREAAVYLSRSVTA